VIAFISAFLHHGYTLVMSGMGGLAYIGVWPRRTGRPIAHHLTQKYRCIKVYEKDVANFIYHNAPIFWCVVVCVLCDNYGGLVQTKQRKILLPLHPSGP
jgi:hypothetical protein